MCIIIRVVFPRHAKFDCIHSVNLLELSFMSKLAGLSPGNDDEVSTICFPHKLNIIVEGW